MRRPLVAARVAGLDESRAPSHGRMERFTALGVTAIIELPPAGTLIGLAKRAQKGVELLAVKTPDDLDAARTLIKEHSA